MQSKTWIALGAMAVIGVMAFLTLRAPEKGELIGPHARPIAALKAGDIKELLLSANAGKDQVTVVREGATWTVTSPVKYPADQSLAKTAAEQIEKIGFGDLVTEKKEKFADFEVSDDKGAHVTAKDAGGKVVFDAWVGKSVSGFTMLRPVGKDQVWQATGLFKYSYARPAKDWRDHSVLTFNKDDAKALTVEAGGQKIAIEKLPPAADPAKTEEETIQKKPPAETRWKVLEASVKVDPLDDSVANQMVQALSNLQAADFGDDARPEETGLATPRFKVTVSTSSTSPPQVLLIGNAKGDDWYAQVAGKPQVFSMHKYNIDRVAQRPVDFRQKGIVKAKGDDVMSVDVTKGADKYTLERKDGGWAWGKGGKGALDEGKAKSVASAFEDFKGDTFAESAAPADTGLAKPEGEVVLHLRDKSSVTILVGSSTKDGQTVHVQRAGSPDVLMVKKYAVERFLKTAAELERSAAPTPPPAGGMPPGMRMPPGMQPPPQ